MTTRRQFLLRSTAAGVVALSSLQIAHAARDKTRKVETVLGPLDVSQLGFTLSHEHVCAYPPKLFSDRSVAVGRMVDKLKQARAAGVDSIVDLTTADVGRDVRFGEEVSRRSGMQIVASTGFRFAPESYNAQTVDQIAERFIREIERGIDDTSIDLLPYLTQLGVSQRAIHAITVDNPERFFGRPP